MKKEFGPAITGIGTYVPRQVFSNEALIRRYGIADTSDEWIQTRVGIERRHIARPEEATSDLAFEAAKQALERARLDPYKIQNILVATATPDHAFPSTAAVLQGKLQPKGGAAAADIAAACTGGIYGLATTYAMHKGGLFDASLMAGAETLSRIVNWQDRSTAVLFGDGAGAVVVQNVQNPGIAEFALHADGTQGDLLKVPAGGSRQPITQQVLAEGKQFLEMKGKKVYLNAIDRMCEAADEVIQKAGLTDAEGNIDPSQIEHVIPHQANARIMEKVWDRLGIQENKRISRIAEYGNTSAASIFLAMNDAYEEGRFTKGDTLLLVAFGGGFTYGAAVLQWHMEQNAA